MVQAVQRRHCSTRRRDDAIGRIVFRKLDTEMDNLQYLIDHVNFMYAIDSLSATPKPTHHLPGTDGKVRVMAMRYASAV